MAVDKIDTKGLIPTTNSSTNQVNSQIFTTNQNASMNVAESGGTFSFLYDPSISEPILDIKNDDDNLYVTKISNYNNFYYKRGYHYKNNAFPSGGYSTAMNMYSDNWDRSWYSKQGYNNASKFDNYTVLANCVGWANARVLEVWNRALKNGYIKYDASKQGYFLKNGSPITGRVYDNVTGNGPTPPACNAVNFYKYWPTATGWSKGSEPKVGALIVWGAHYSTSGNPGHVAFVEKVEDNGDIIISESSAANSGIHWLVQLYKLKKSNGYTRYYDHVLVGFCYSPVCELASSNGYRTVTEFGGIIEPTPEQIEAYNKAVENISGLTVEVEFDPNDKVEIVWLGSKDPNGDFSIKSRVNNMGVIGIVGNKINGAKFPYPVRPINSNYIIGYYRWEDLKRV